MSLETNIGRSVIDLGEVLTANIVTELAKSNTEGKFSLTSEELSVVAEIVKNSVYTTCMGAVDSFTATVRNNQK